MAVNDIHTLYACNIGAVFIDQVSNFSLAPGIQEVLAAGDGQVDPTYVANMSQRPVIGVTTSDLVAALGIGSDTFLTSGVKISSGASNADFWFQKLAEGGARASGAAPIKMTVNEGLLVPRQFGATQDAIAQVALELVCTYDGSNDPIVIATSQALEGTPATSALHTIGPVKFNGTTVNGVQSIIYDPGLTLIAPMGDGEKWPTYVAIMNRAPMLTVTTLDIAAFATFGLEGAAQDATDSVAYFRKLAEGGGRVADATEEHIKLAFDEGIITPQTIPATQGSPAMLTLQYRPTYDGTNAICVIDTTAAIV